MDIDAGKRLVEAIKPLARATARPGAAADLGGFGGEKRDPMLTGATARLGDVVLTLA